MTPRRIAATACAALLVACSGSSGGPEPGGAAGAADFDRNGPMRPAPAHGTLARGPVGTRITDGLDVLFLAGSEPATVLEVRSVGGDEGVRFLGAKIAGPQRRIAGWSQLPGYPPRSPALGPLVEAGGATILPRDQTRGELGYELLMGYEVTDDDDIAIRTRIDVVYQVGDELYLHSSPGQLVYCPRRLSSDECFQAAEEVD